MPSRRDVLLAGGSLAVTSLAGCLDTPESDATVREVSILLYNMGSTSQTFEFALELEAETLEWESHTVEAQRNQVAVIDPPEGAYPVALHGRVNEYDEVFEFTELTHTDGDFCLYLYFYYQHPYWGQKIRRAPHLECE